MDFLAGADCCPDGVNDGESALNVFLEALRGGQKKQEGRERRGERLGGANSQVCLRGWILVLVMVERAPLVLVTAVTIYQDVAAECILVFWRRMRVSSDVTATEDGRNPPRPLDLGEPT